jgi:hypothetical protein
MDAKTIISAMVKGNPGAMQFLNECAMLKVPYPILAKLVLFDIMGTDLYVLWSDICDKDMRKVKQLVENCPGDLLKDACSRQDYSGRKLVAHIFEAEKN